MHWPKRSREEWRAQGDEIDQQSMPFTKLANTAIDGVTPRRDEVIARDRRRSRSTIISAIAPTRRPNSCAARARRGTRCSTGRQQRYGAPLLTIKGVTSIAQPENSIAALRKAVAAFDPFALAALHVAASICGSLVLALAMADGRLTAAEAFALSQIDERFQAEKWGLDSEAEARAKRLEQELVAAERFLRLL